MRIQVYRGVHEYFGIPRRLSPLGEDGSGHIRDREFVTGIKFRTDAPLVLVLLEVRDDVGFRRFELDLFDRSQPRPFP
jgi:hypothetical protein